MTRPRGVTDELRVQSEEGGSRGAEIRGKQTDTVSLLLLSARLRMSVWSPLMLCP